MQTALHIPLDGVTATTTSSAVSIEDAIGVTFVFTRADHSAGNTVFSVTVSADEANDGTYITYNKLIDNVTNANTETLTRVASSTLSSNTSKTYLMDLRAEGFKWMKITATETTDGTHTAKALVRYDT